MIRALYHISLIRRRGYCFFSLFVSACSRAVFILLGSWRLAAMAE